MPDDERRSVPRARREEFDWLRPIRPLYGKPALEWP